MSCKLRILSDNAADRAAVSSPTSIASGMPLSSLKTDIRGQACRALAPTFTLVLEWNDLETVGVVALPLTSLGANSTIRVRAYLNPTDTTPLADSGVNYAAPGVLLENWGFSQPLNVNAFNDVDLPIVSCFFEDQVACRKLTIELADPDAAFIDVSRLVAGGYVELDYGAAYGASSAVVDLTKNSRAESGDYISDWRPKAKSLTFNLEWVSATDRPRVRQLLFKGIGKNVFVSLLSDNPDPVIARDYMIYGKQAQVGSMTYSFYQNHATQITIESF